MLLSQYSLIFVHANREFRQDRSTGIGNISEDLVGSCPGSRDSPDVTGNERGTVFTGRGRMSGDLIQGVIVVLGENRKPLMIPC